MSKPSNKAIRAYTEAGDSSDLADLLVKAWYKEVLEEWETEIGRPGRQAERNPLALSAFMYSIIDIQNLTKEGKLDDARQHMTRAIQSTNTLIGRPVSGSSLDASDN